MLKIYQVAAFDFIEIDDYVNDFLKIPPAAPYNANFESLGMESTYMLNNLGSLLLIYLSYPVLLILYRSIYTFRNCSNCCKATQKRLQKKLF